MCGITQQELKEILSYNSETGAFTWLTKRKGKQAGAQDANGYCRIRINTTLYKVHRLAWLYVHGQLPTGFIDHINGDPSDNRIANLRECSHQENLWNIGVRRSNKSGFRGVHWHTRSGKWRAQISINGKLCDIGHYSTADLASEAYETRAKELHGEFYRAPIGKSSVI